MKKFNLLLVLLLVSCSTRQTNINLDDIFEQKENEYYVLFYLDGCMACRNTKLKIEELNKRYNLNYYYIDLFDLYFDNPNQNNIGVNNYLDIVVNTAPTLFFINNKCVEKEYIGYEKVNEWVKLINS